MRVRTLVVDDSAYNRVTITRMLQSDERIEVVGSAVNGEDAIKHVVRHEPHVITLDLEMPGMDGFTFLRWLMANRPTAVIVISSKSSDRSMFKALELGALDFIVKPGGSVSPRLPEIERELIAKVLSAPHARLDNLRRGQTDRKPAPFVAPVGQSRFDVVAIGCSTGGPTALEHLLHALPLLPVSIVVAQHMPATFTRLFAERLNRLTEYDVREAADGDSLAPGHVYIAPGGKQMQIERSAAALTVRIEAALDQDHYAPSVDRLMSSASEHVGSKLIGVLMTGMGDDGAAGMRAIRDRGGTTIAESADTAVIFGMPNQAIKIGAAEHVLPLDEISRAIERMCTGATD